MGRKRKSGVPIGANHEPNSTEHASPDHPLISNVGFGFGGGYTLPGVGIGGGSNFIYPGPGGGPTISDAAPMFVNMRWYLVSNNWQMLSQAYVELGLVQTIVDLPVDDALRGGIEIKSKQLDPAQVEELQIALDRNDDLGAAGLGAKWNRLYGGAGILILTDQDPETELDLESIGKDTPLEFRAADMWELVGDKQATEGLNVSAQPENFTHYNYYGNKIHKTRVMKLKGITAPAFIRPRLRGWGFSVVESLVRSINQYLKATDVAYELLDEAKIDVYKIKNLTTALMSPTGMQAIAARVADANRQKNYQHALTMDSEDDWDHKQMAFTGLAEMLGQIRMQVASDLRIPMTKLFGMSATGFNSGEDDIENYNAMIESSIRGKLKYDLLRICEIRCQKLFGFTPTDMQIAFKPLRVMSSEQEEAVKTQKFNRLLQAKQIGLVSDREFRDSANQGNLFDIKLESEDITDSSDTAETEDAGENLNPHDAGTSKEGIKYPGSDTEDTGANRADPKKSRADEVANSFEYERHAFEAAGGDSWMDPDRLKLIIAVTNGALWERAKEASQSEYGAIRWPFVAFIYKRLGGKF